MNTSKKQVQTMCITAMLIALGVLVPMISPIKLILEPMSFTLGSHIAIMAAMFVAVQCGQRCLGHGGRFLSGRLYAARRPALAQPCRMGICRCPLSAKASIAVFILAADRCLHACHRAAACAV